MAREQDGSEEPRLVQTEPGERRTYRGRNSGREVTATLGREWEVHLGDELLGTIRYDMVTRERGPRQRPYVSARWQSPGWTYLPRGRGGRRLHALGKADAIERLVR